MCCTCTTLRTQGLPTLLAAADQLAVSAPLAACIEQLTLLLAYPITFSWELWRLACSRSLHVAVATVSQQLTTICVCNQPSFAALPLDIVLQLLGSPSLTITTELQARLPLHALHA